jgi:hypothetical protein
MPRAVSIKSKLMATVPIVFSCSFASSRIGSALPSKLEVVPKPYAQERRHGIAQKYQLKINEQKVARTIRLPIRLKCSGRRKISRRHVLHRPSVFKRWKLLTLKCKERQNPMATNEDRTTQSNARRASVFASVRGKLEFA